MNNRQLNRVLNGALAVGLALAVMVIGGLALRPMESATATGAADGGIIRWQSKTIMSGTQSYMATTPVSTFETSAVYVGDFGAVQYQIAVDVPDDEITGPIAITWTPQFSIQPIGNCDNATAWFDGTVYQVSGYTLDYASMSARTLGTQTIGFEVSTVGACTRLQFAAPVGAVFTPTAIYLRMVNRQ